MLPTVNDPAVLELEDNAVGHVQVLAVAIPGAVLEADHVAVVICGQVLQLRPGTCRPSPVPSWPKYSRIASAP